MIFPNFAPARPHAGHRATSRNVHPCDLASANGSAVESNRARMYWLPHGDPSARGLAQESITITAVE